MNGLSFTQHVHMSVSPGALCSLHLHAGEKYVGGQDRRRELTLH